MLKVSEHFYSIQGEGRTMGVPSVFLRLSNCNLLCGGAKTQIDGKLHDGATWRCDSIETWLKGKKLTANELLEVFEKQGYIEPFKHGAHLILTGGEPMLQQEGIMEFLLALAKSHEKPFTEIETNGTILPSEQFWGWINQWNISPKLSNSGMPKGLRIKPEAITRFARCVGVQFKFVVSSVTDIEEVEKDFIKPFNINNQQVWLMPAADCREKLQELQEAIATYCKAYCFNYSHRLHIDIWNKKTGV